MTRQQALTIAKSRLPVWLAIHEGADREDSIISFLLQTKLINEITLADVLEII